MILRCGVDGCRTASGRESRYTFKKETQHYDFWKHWLEIHIFITSLTGITTGYGYTKGHYMAFDRAVRAEVGGDYLYRYTRSVTVFAG